MKTTARFTFTFDSEMMKDPVLYNIAMTHDVVPNIKRASVDPNGGQIEVELEGEETDIEACIKEMRNRGVTVRPDKE